MQILSQENVADLLQLFQQVKMGQHGASTSDISVKLSCTGITKFFDSYACFIQINSVWMLDSRATEHM